MQKGTALVTGASRGIGRAAALLFAREGFRVAVNYNRSEQAARAVVDEIRARGGTAEAFGADISSEPQVERLFAQCEERLGEADVLVNNAGIAQQKLFTDLTAADWARVFGVDVTGVFLCCRRALPAMIRRKRGKIVNVSSMWGVTGASCEVAYSAAKAAVIGLTRALAKEAGPSGIQVNCVAPGVVDTEMNAALSAQDRAALCDETPLERLGTPGEVAQAILFLASEKADFITGQVLGVNGGFVI